MTSSLSVSDFNHQLIQSKTIKELINKHFSTYLCHKSLNLFVMLFQSELVPESDKPSKVEYEVAKYLRSKLPPKKTTLLGHKVDYFIGLSIDLFHYC